MATIINKTDGIEVINDGGSVYFIKYDNCKLIKYSTTLSIYDNSERRQGSNRLRFTPAQVSDPVHWCRMGDGDTYPFLLDTGSAANCIYIMYSMTSSSIVNDVP